MTFNIYFQTEFMFFTLNIFTSYFLFRKKRIFQIKYQKWDHFILVRENIFPNHYPSSSLTLSIIKFRPGSSGYAQYCSKRWC